MELLLQSLVAVTRLSEQELSPILDRFYPISVPAHTMLVIPGTVVRTVWIVASRLLRAIYHVEKKKRTTIDTRSTTREVTSWTAPASGFLTDIRSFLHQTPSSYYIETLERSQLYGRFQFKVLATYLNIDPTIQCQLRGK